MEANSVIFCSFWITVLCSRHSAKCFIHTLSSKHPTNADIYTHFTNEEIKTQEVKWITQDHKLVRVRTAWSIYQGPIFFFPQMFEWKKVNNSRNKTNQFGALNQKFHFADNQRKFTKSRTFSSCIKITVTICKGPFFLLTHGNYIFTLQLQIWFLVFPFCFHKHTFTDNC